MARTIISTIPGEEWGPLLTGFTRSAFRLESFQYYVAPDEVEALARRQTEAGRTMSRVRVIIEPPSEYTRFELIAYPVMAAAGDDIRIISVDPGEWPADVPHHDYWLFDDHDVWVLNYDQDGVLRSAELQHDRQVVLDHQRWRDAALAQAIPIRDYLQVTARRAP